MKSYSDLISIFEQMKKYKSPEEIARKHKMPLSAIMSQLKIGIPIEHEHTQNNHLATIIALQHLEEFPDYYTRLRKLETSAKKKIEEKYTRIQKTGNTYTILLNWRNMPKSIQMFFPNMKRPTLEEVSAEVNKVYPGAKVLSYKPSILDPTKPYLITGDI